MVWISPSASLHTAYCGLISQEEAIIDKKFVSSMKATEEVYAKRVLSSYFAVYIAKFLSLLYLANCPCTTRPIVLADHLSPKLTLCRCEVLLHMMHSNSTAFFPADCSTSLYIICIFLKHQATIANCYLSLFWGRWVQHQSKTPYPLASCDHLSCQRNSQRF